MRKIANGVPICSRRSCKDFDWQRMINHITAEICIVTCWLSTLIGSGRARQKRVAAWLGRRDPIIFPAAPSVRAYRVNEIAPNPGCAGVDADPDLGDIGVPRPSGSEN